MRLSDASPIVFFVGGTEPRQKDEETMATAATQEQISAAIDWATSMRAAGCADAYAKTYDGNVDGRSVKILRGVECYLRDVKSGNVVLRTVTDFAAAPEKVLAEMKREMKARARATADARRVERETNRS